MLATVLVNGCSTGPGLGALLSMVWGALAGSTEHVLVPTLGAWFMSIVYLIAYITLFPAEVPQRRLIAEKVKGDTPLPGRKMTGSKTLKMVLNG